MSFGHYPRSQGHANGEAADYGWFDLQANDNEQAGPPLTVVENPTPEIDNTVKQVHDQTFTVVNWLEMLDK